MNTPCFAGIDVGSAQTKAVLLNIDSQVVSRASLPTGWNPKESAEKTLALLLNQAGVRQADVIVATGYGRVTLPFAQKNLTEISCHARGASHLFPTAGVVIDIGGQDSKVIRLDAAGNVVDFTMNDKCAAGTGRFLEMMANTLQLPLDEMAQRGVDYRKNVVISSTCSVFAESEVISLIAQNTDVDDIVHGLNDSVASRVAGLARRVGGEEPYLMTGGVARNRGLVQALEKRLGAPVKVPELAQYCGALGAALIDAGK